MKKWKKGLAVVTVLVGAFLFFVPPVSAKKPGHNRNQDQAVHLQAIAKVAELNSIFFEVAASVAISIYSGKVNVVMLPKQWESTNAELAKLISADQQADCQKIVKFYAKLQQAVAAVAEKAEQLKQQKVADSTAVTEFVRSRQAVRYCLGELMRHLVQSMDIAQMSHQQREQLGEIINLMRMEQEIQVAILLAFYENSPYVKMTTSQFWVTISEFDVSYSAYQALVKKNERQKIGLLRQIKQLKDQVLELGGTLYEAQKSQQLPTMDQANELALVSAKLGSYFRTLKRCTL